MMRPGDRIKIRSEGGERYWGRVVSAAAETEMLDVTIGPSLCGPPADTYRKFAPGRTSVTLTVVVEGPRAKGEVD